MKYFKNIKTREGVGARFLGLCALCLLNNDGDARTDEVQSEFDTALDASIDVDDPADMERAWHVNPLEIGVSISELYDDCGWRPEHRDHLKIWGNLTDDEADQICELLKEYAEK